ncbi:MAG TPA: phage major capsid protein [Caproicibacter sp.]|nr:phage major capsid protein [Caproicibacter sp.]
MAFLSKAMRELVADKETKSSALQAIMAKADAPTKEIEDATAALSAVNAKIAAQTSLDTGKKFDEGGQEVTSKTPKASTCADKFASMEYRQAFMDYVKNGKSSNILEFRDAKTGSVYSLDQSTSTSDAAAVIPSTILQEVIEKVESYGNVYARVRKLAIKGGVKVPLLSVKPVATWIGENSTGDKQKVDLSASINFTYYGLECKIATSIVADAATIDMFESILINLIGEAMTKALDVAIVSGAGSSSPLGITKDPRVTKVVTLSPTEFGDWSAWKKKVFSKLSAAYKGGATFLMASGTFEGYIDGMVDANGQPIGRTNFGIANLPQDTFGGREVIEVEDDVIANYDDASTGDVVAIYGNLNNYAINSNMQLMMYRYLDHTTNEWVDKAILVADGKTLDANGFVVVKKGA